MTELLRLSFTNLGIFAQNMQKRAKLCNKKFAQLAKFCKKVLTNEYYCSII